MHAFITGTLLAVTLITGAPKHHDAPAPVKEKGWKKIFYLGLGVQQIYTK